MLLGQRRHHEPRVGSLGQVLGLGHHPPLPAPTVQRPIPNVREDARRLPGCLELPPGLLQRLGDQLSSRLFWASPNR